MNWNIQEDFQICINVSLMKHHSFSKKSYFIFQSSFLSGDLQKIIPTNFTTFYRFSLGYQKTGTRDPRKTRKPRPRTLASSQKKRKIRIRDPSETLVASQNNLKTETRELRKTRKPVSKTLAGPQKNRKIGTRDPSVTLQNLENQDPGLQWDPRKPKKRDTVPQWSPQTGETNPNVTLEKL